MKILLLGDYPRGETIQTGVQGVLVGLTDGLISQSAEALILVSTNRSTYLNRYREDCTVYELDDMWPSIINAKRQFRTIIEKENPDIIHLQGVVPGCLLYNRKYRQKFIVTQHAILKEERRWQVSLQRKIKFWIKEQVERYYLKRIKNIIFISGYNKAIFEETYGHSPERNTITLPNPVNALFTRLERQNPFGAVDEIYFVGEIKKRKGLHILLRAMAILKDKHPPLKLHVIGGFKEMAYRSEIRGLIDSLNLDEDVIFCGWKSPEEIIAYTRDIPIFVLPSFQETLPLSIAEAMAQQKLVVASDVGGTSEMIEDKQSGFLFPAGDHEALAAILYDILNNPEKGYEMAARACKSSQRYQAEVVVQKTREFYSKICTGSHTS